MIAVWVLAVVALALGARAAGQQNSDNLSLPGTGSTNAQDLLKSKLPKQAYGTNPIVLSSFVLNGSAIVKEFGVGLAAAIAIDATIVRCLAVPAVMALFGNAAWWLPKWLDRVLPRISIEGEDYFAERDKLQSEPDTPPLPAGA